MTIYKYPLAFREIETVSMPAGAQILSVQVQDGTLCLWALVDTSAKMQDRLICIFTTGHPPCGDHGKFIGTVQTHGGQFVWHVFSAS